METPRSLIALRGLFALTLLVAAPLACGRTDLDDPGFGETGVGAGGASAHGGSGGASTGQGGATGGTGGRVSSGGAGGRAGAGGATGGSGGGAGGATGGSGGGTGGAAGGAGGAPPPTPIPCGMTTCAGGSQSCCVQRGASTCIAAGAMCAGGASFSCVDTASCGAGRVCCLGLLGISTTCTTSAACSVQPGLTLCATDSDCNPLAPHCCVFRGVGGVCAAQTCAPGRGAGPPPAP